MPVYPGAYDFFNKNDWKIVAAQGILPCRTVCFELASMPFMTPEYRWIPCLSNGSENQAQSYKHQTWHYFNGTSSAGYALPLIGFRLKQYAIIKSIKRDVS